MTTLILLFKHYQEGGGSWTNEMFGLWLTLVIAKDSSLDGKHSASLYLSNLALSLGVYHLCIIVLTCVDIPRSFPLVGLRGGDENNVLITESPKKTMRTLSDSRTRIFAVTCLQL